MNTLSFTQEFFVCAVNEKGKTPFAKKTEVLAGLVVGGILELTSNGYIKADKKEKYSVVKPPESLEHLKTKEPNLLYLQPLYDVIAVKPMKSTAIAEKYLNSGKLFAEFFNAIGKSLAEVDCAKESVNQGLFGEKVVFIPTSECATAIIEKIRAELLENGTVSDETIILCALLDKCGLIKDYFSKVESDKLKIRLKEIRNSDAHSKIRKVIDSIDSLVVAMVAASVIINS